VSDNREEIIKDAIESIEPGEGSRERMLVNIMRKAAEQYENENISDSPAKKKMEENKRYTRINRIMRWAAPLAACLVLVLAGGLIVPKMIKGKNTGNSGLGVQIANPLVPVEDAKAIEEALGIGIEAPSGATNVEYYVLSGKIADIRFNCDGHDYTFRASESNEDFAGLNGKEISSEKLDTDKKATLTVIASGESRWTKIDWKEGKIAFVIVNTDGASEDEIKAVFEKICNR